MSFLDCRLSARGMRCWSRGNAAGGSGWEHQIFKACWALSWRTLASVLMRRVSRSWPNLVSKFEIWCSALPCGAENVARGSCGGNGREEAILKNLDSLEGPHISENLRSRDPPT